MFKIDNELIEIKVFKNGSLVKRDYFKNRLTNLYLDYILFRMLPLNVASTMFTNFDDTGDSTLAIFSTAYISFFDDELDDTDTQMFYNQTSAYPLLTDQIRGATGANDKTMEIDFGFEFSSVPANTFLKTIGFGRFQPAAFEYLFSFIDVSGLNIGIEDGMRFVITRFDRMTSNAVGTSGTYFPFLGGDNVLAGRLAEIRVCYDRTGGCNETLYDVDNLTFTRISAGYVEISGFENFYLSEDGLFPSDDLYMGYDIIEETALIAKPFDKKGYTYLLGSGTSAGLFDFLEVGKEYYGTQAGKRVFFKLILKSTSGGIATIVLNGDGNQLQLGVDITGVTEIEYTLFPVIKGKPERVVFVYELNDNTRQEVYVDMKDLDVTYNDKTFKINYKIERGGA